MISSRPRDVLVRDARTPAPANGIADRRKDRAPKSRGAEAGIAKNRAGRVGKTVVTDYWV